VLTAAGETLDLRRGDLHQKEPPFRVPEIHWPATTKNTAGYYLRPDADYLDLFIGSEGTLGVITAAELALLPAPATLTAGVLFFDSENAALDAVGELRAAVAIRMIEYFDAASLELLRSRFAEIPADAGGALLVECEGSDTDWFAGDYREESWIALNASDRERFRQFRHALPEAVNDLMRRRGLMKTGSDYAVPIDCNREMLAIYRAVLGREFPGQYVIFGHIGDAHLHVNILPAGNAEWARAQELMLQFARDAVRLGGTVSAEHGLGKRKRALLRIQYSDEEIEKMKDVKRRLDPQWLLGRGNLFDSVERE
jgi:FAD/FMN-containing dehydrogenase